MAANLSSLFVLFIFLHSISNIVQSEVIKRIYVPHNAPTGYYVTKISKWANWELQDNLGKDTVPDLFSLSNTGELKTSQPMADRVGQVFVLSVVNVQMPSEGSDEIHIKIENATYMLHFSKQLYTGVISENSPKGVEVKGLGEVYASDNHHSTDSINYRIIAGNSNKSFYLKPIYVNDKTENRLIAQKTLDREQQETYDLLIEAKSKSGKKAHSTIRVVVLDQDDNKPTFPVPRYTVSLTNDVLAGTSVFQIQATDPDKSEITYHMTPNKFFEIMPATGDIIVTGLEEADEHVYSLTIYATDSSGHRSDDVRVDIQIDSTLKFVHRRVRVRRAARPNLQFNILENKTGFLFTIESTPRNVNERFQLITPKSIFVVNSQSGDVSVTAGQLDYDDSTKRQYVLNFDITNTGDPSSRDTLQVTVDIQNVNDESPVFINKPVPFLAVISMTEHPGSVLYTLACTDADPGSAIAYNLEAGGEGRFAVHPSTGAVTTLGEGSFAINKVYTLSVSCEDTSTTGQKTEARVEVMVGTRPPQFSEMEYSGEVRENTAQGFRIKRVEALSFRGNSITYTLQTPPNTAQYFTLIPDNDANGAFIETLSSLDYETDARQFTLQITASESDVLSSSVNIIIDLIDVNDSPPRFSLSTYPVSGIAENTVKGTSILTVTATDADFGTNAQITYSINNLNNNNQGNHFEVETRKVGGVYEGIIKIKDPLDYEASPDHVYLFSITAIDHGAAPLTGTATVDVSVTNVNDEAPVFSLISAVPLREDSQPGTVVTFVQANDADGDSVEFTFNGGATRESVFEIVREQGLIKLTATVPPDMVLYNLNVTAIDDGSCCPNMGPSSLNSTIVVPIDIKDINNNSPHFPDCGTYTPTIMENEPTGTTVITISAVDDDRGTNGLVTYSLYTNTRFEIASDTGIISSTVVFDRENENNIRSYDVTIYARDSGTNPRDGLCTITVDIGDMNDNEPKFESTSYETSVSSQTSVGSTLYRVKANDPDAGNNGLVSYFIVPDSATFRIDNEGVIYLMEAIDGDSQTITVKAEDNGSPTNLSSQATVKFTVAGSTVNRPAWDAGLDGRVYEVNETSPVNTVIGTMCADSRTSNAGVSFSILGADGPTTVHGKFAIQSSSRANCTELIVNSALDAELLQDHDVRLRVTSLTQNPLSDEIRVKVRVLDQNDQVPVFGRPQGDDHFISGSIMENGTGNEVEIIAITATDSDKNSPNNLVTYSLADDNGLFSIRPGDGTVSSSHIFDREKQSYYYLSVIGQDGAPSVRPNMNGRPNSATAQVRIIILDANDNPPKFEPALYAFSVEESADTNFLVGTVTATDLDSVINQELLYSITNGNNANAFTITQYTGEIQVNGILDYEGPYKHYTLTVRASDGLHEAYGTVDISIIDVNDNRPVFSQKIYQIRDIVEEDQTISSATPRFLITVNATDADVDRPNRIEYRLQEDTPDLQASYSVNSASGQVYLKRPLDRDPTDGRVLYEFTILAIDEPQSDNYRLGYATIQIYPLDINDNKPKFDENGNVGSVAENSPTGTTVMTVVATDPDNGVNGTVFYTIISGQVDSTGNSYFTIDNNGLIRTGTPELDREKNATYLVTIMARDGGTPPESGSGTVTVQLLDVNDNAPVFNTKIFKSTMSESLPEHSSVMAVTATDNDIDNNARLTYRLEGTVALEHFYMENVQVSNTGVLRLYHTIDYEVIKANPFFNLTVVVQDPLGIAHSDTAYIEVIVEDYNDNAPEFTKPHVYMDILENIPVETSLTDYHAFDIDSGINQEFYFSIDRATDKNRQFRIEDYGNGTATVFVRRSLDRETDPTHKVHILATDKGTPALTGTATLSLVLLDINDNYPIFKEDYRPVVYENQPANASVVLIFAIDLDTEINAGDFFFSLPCTDAASPCCTDNPTCKDFFMQFNRDGDGGRGTGLVSSRALFDRETQKYYHVPIIMSDSGNPKMTGTNTLTVTIGDENDNPHFPGHLDSYVYNYRGKYGDIIVGRVYAEDKDDWDIVDKTFILTGPPKMKNYFEVDKDSGAITMFKGVPEGNYTFEATVYDKVFDKTVTSTVTVHVKEISEQAVYSSGSIRFSGITDEQFIFRPSGGQSKYDTLRQTLAATFSTVPEFVEIFSVMQNGNYLDVRYAAHGSPWYKASKMDGLVELQRNQIYNALGQDMDIIMVNIDECLDEICESQGCTNIFSATDFPTMINANGTALVGVTTTLTSECICKARNFTSPLECTPDHCYNNGTCTKNKWDVVSCTCSAGFDGPRCQQTHQSFSGNSYALYPTLTQCEDSRTSIEFITTQADGLILYNGPVHDLDPAAGDEADFIALELVNGYPRLVINHGTGTLVLQLDGRNSEFNVVMQPLHDGLWHRVDIIRKARDVWLVADYCRTAIPAQSNVMSSVEDRAPCESFGRTPGENAFINVNTMLQLGGRYQQPVYPPNLMQTSFNGCVKNLIHNSELYDLHIGDVGLGANNNDRCLGEEEVCGLNSAVDPYCGANGICIGSLPPKDIRQCQCLPGYRMGRNSQICDTRTSTRDFQDPNSFMEWDFKDEMYNQLLQNPRTFAIQIMFRTNDQAGTIFRAQSAGDQNDFVEIKLRDGKVDMVYDVGELSLTLRMADAPASDGVWHTLSLRRYDRQFILKMDGGEGRYYVDSMGPATGEVEFKVTKSQIFVGAHVTYQAVNQASNLPVVDTSTDLNEACIDDVRYGYEYRNEKWFPMMMTENDQSFAAILVTQSHVKDDCVRDDCVGAICPPGLICEEMWGRYECWCPPDMKKVGQECVPKGCDDEPCFGLSTCEAMTDGTGFLCHCPPGFTGRTCNMHVDYSSRAAGLTTEALVVILVCLFLILVLVVAFILYFRTHKPMDKLILEVDPDDDIRENIINYDEEGAGEDDKGEYDISRLRKPEDGGMLPRKYPMAQPEHMRPLGRGAPNDNPDVGDFIEDRLNDADGDPSAPPHDSVRVFEYEGGGSDAGSLSSLNTSTSSGDKDYYFLNDWGPKFSKLADMYGGGQSDED